ncbi:MAG: glycosyltransferase [bacterium]
MQKIITVVVPTYKHENRMNDLLNLVESLTVISNLEYIYEILVVDNGSSLDKESDCLKFLSHKRVRIVDEPCIGLNYARNTGIAVASAEIIAFLDDDVIVSPTWAESIISGHRNIGVLCVGGPVNIRNKMLCYPAWFSEYFLRFLLPMSFPKASGQLSPPYFLIGANMSFKKGVFEKYGTFDPFLDRKGDNLLSNGDLEFIIRLPQNSVRFEVGAIASEEIKENRLTRSFSVRRVFWQGISDAIMVRKRGLHNFYDRNEVFLNRHFVRKFVSASVHRNFFEAFCALVRLAAYKYKTIFLKLKKRGRIFPPLFR